MTGDTIEILFIAAAVVAAVLVLRRLIGGGKVSGQTIKDLIDQGARVVDVRTPDEFAGGAYPKARNIPLQALASRMRELEPRDRPVVVYCASGARSAMAARALKMSGFATVVNAGGLGDMPRP
jgi:phage shock protein E